MSIILISVSCFIIKKILVNSILFACDFSHVKENTERKKNKVFFQF